MDVAVHEDRRELGGAGQQVGPRRGARGPAETVRGLRGRVGAGGRVECPMQPAMMAGVVVARRASPGERRRLQFTHSMARSGR